MTNAKEDDEMIKVESSRVYRGEERTGVCMVAQLYTCSTLPQITCMAFK